MLVKDAHANPAALMVEGAVMTGGAPGAAAANSQRHDGFDDPWDQSTTLPVHVEILNKLLGRNPDDEELSSTGYIFPKWNITGQRTETLVDQPGSGDSDYSFPKELIKLPLMVFSYKSTGKPFGGVTLPSSNERRYDHDYEKHKPVPGGLSARWGEVASINPIPNWEVGQKLLDTAYTDSRKQNQFFNYYNGNIIKFRSSNDGKWHAYEINSNVNAEVGDKILKQFCNDGLITKAEYRKLIKK